MVFEGTNLKKGPGSQETPRSVAMKILNPVGFKLMPSGPLQRCTVAKKGQPLAPGQRMSLEHVWWVVNPNSRAIIAAQQVHLPSIVLAPPPHSSSAARKHDLA